jgi:hypothetical protein
MLTQVQAVMVAAVLSLSKDSLRRIYREGQTEAKLSPVVTRIGAQAILRQA